jgi:hypothetical protein
MKTKFKRIPNDRDFRRLLDEIGKADFRPIRRRGRWGKAILYLLFFGAIGAGAYFYRSDVAGIFDQVAGYCLNFLSNLK